jgi:mannose-6-phosphate isomerase-like protein (cupin superfamily)
MRIFLCAAMMMVGFGTVVYGQAAPATPLATLSESRVYPFADMPARKTANGGESRDSLRGLLLSGEAVAVHESVMPVGAPAPALHVINHSEIITVVEGTLEFMHGDKVERVGPGGIIYVAMGTSHAVKNVGDVPARYVVVAIGGDVKK